MSKFENPFKKSPIKRLFGSSGQNKELGIKNKAEGAEQTFSPEDETRLYITPEMYNEQVEALKTSGLIYNLPKSKEFGFIDIENNERILPTYEQVIEKITPNLEIIKRKRFQGFVELQLTPILTPLSFLTEKAKEEILKAKKDGRLKSTSGEDLELDTKQPLYIDKDLKDADINGKLIYFPQKYNENNHGGLTKKELKNDHRLLNGFIISLFEDLPDLPSQGNGQEVGGREQIEANKSPEQYLKLLQTEEEYENESGLTPEMQIVYFISNLQRGRVIDDYLGQGKINWLTGAYLKGLGVPDWDWRRGSRQAYLSWFNPDSLDGDFGCRASAII